MRQTARRRIAYDLAVAAALAAGGALLIALALSPGALAFAAPPDGPPGADRSAEANRGARAVPHGEDGAPGREQAAAGQPSADAISTEDDDATSRDEGDATPDGDDRTTPGPDAAGDDDTAEDDDQAGDDGGSDTAPGDDGQDEACAGDLEVRIVDVEGDLRGGGRIVLDDDADVVDGSYVIADGLRVFSGVPCVTVAVSLSDPPEGTVLAAREATEKLVMIESDRTAAVEFAVEEATTPPERDADATTPDTAADGEDDVAEVLPVGPRDRTVGDGAALADPARHPRTGVGAAGLAALGTFALVGGGALLRRRGDVSRDVPRG